MNTTLSKSPRIEVVDALRGFAVIAICLVHSLEHFIFPVYPESSPEWLMQLDQIVFDATFFLFAGKAYAIFALLFGFTFFIQQRNQLRKGKDFGYTYLWRLLLLAGFATLNAAFFPAGDVLLLFSITGISLFLVRNLSNKLVLIIAVICLLQPFELYNFIQYLLDPNYAIPDLQVGPMYAAIGESTKSGNFGTFLWNNITLGQKASLFWAINAGRFVQTIGLFLLGYLIARQDLFLNNPANKKFWVRALIIGAILFVPLYIIHGQVMGSDVDAIKKTVGTTLDMWHKLAFTFILVAIFVQLYQLDSFKKACSPLTFYGKMSLSNYVGQSILGAIIYFPFGLYLAPYAGYTVSLFIGFFIVILQIIFCKWWLKSHRQGPLEGLWHKLTWMWTSKN